MAQLGQPFPGGGNDEDGAYDEYKKDWTERTGSSKAGSGDHDAGDEPDRRHPSAAYHVE